MQTSLVMKKIYIDIQEKLYYMIPEKWDSIYLYASIIDGLNNIESGEMFFYYYPKGILKKEPVNVYEIPTKFNIEETEYNKLADSLYERIKKLRYEFEYANNKKWSNITIIIKNYQFQIEFGYEDLKNSKYNSYDRHLIWRYIYLDTSINTYNKEERKIINSYLKEYNLDIQNKDRYLENIYKNKVHNNSINYNKESKLDDNIEELKFVPNKKKKEKKENRKEDEEIQEKRTINQILRY